MKDRNRPNKKEKNGKEARTLDRKPQGKILKKKRTNGIGKEIQ